MIKQPTTYIEQMEILKSRNIAGAIAIAIGTPIGLIIGLIIQQLKNKQNL